MPSGTRCRLGRGIQDIPSTPLALEYGPESPTHICPVTDGGAGALEDVESAMHSFDRGAPRRKFLMKVRPPVLLLTEEGSDYSPAESAEEWRDELLAANVGKSEVLSSIKFRVHETCLRRRSDSDSLRSAVSALTELPAFNKLMRDLCRLLLCRCGLPEYSHVADIF